MRLKIEKNPFAKRLSFFFLVGIESLLVLLLSLCWGCHSFQAMISTLLGGIVWIFPNACFIQRFFFSNHSVSDPRKILRSFYKNEFLQLAGVALLTAFIFLKLSVLILPFLSGLSITILISCFVPLVFSESPRTKAIIQ